MNFIQSRSRFLILSLIFAGLLIVPAALKGQVKENNLKRTATEDQSPDFEKRITDIIKNLT